MSRRRAIPCNPALKSLAKQLRQNMTFAEVLLWQKLQGKQMMGYDFHRQKPVGEFIIDFYCPDLMLEIEIDGRTHDDPERFERDEALEVTLNHLDIDLLRFLDREVKQDMGSVLRMIETWIEAHGEG